LWAAGVLGALAIVIAILIVLNAQDRKDNQLPPPTITNTTIVTPPPSPSALPAPSWQGPDWTDEGLIREGGIHAAAYSEAAQEQTHR
jgi:serine/threonine-protein kinase